MSITMTQTKRRLESVTQRAESVKANIARLEGSLRDIEKERADLEAAHRVFVQLGRRG